MSIKKGNVKEKNIWNRKMIAKYYYYDEIYKAIVEYVGDSYYIINLNKDHLEHNEEVKGRKITALLSKNEVPKNVSFSKGDRIEVVRIGEAFSIFKANTVKLFEDLKVGVQYTNKFKIIHIKKIRNMFVLYTKDISFLINNDGCGDSKIDNYHIINNEILNNGFFYITITIEKKPDYDDNYFIDFDEHTVNARIIKMEDCFFAKINKLLFPINLYNLSYTETKLLELLDNRTLNFVKHKWTYNRGIRIVKIKIERFDIDKIQENMKVLNYSDFNGKKFFLLESVRNRQIIGFMEENDYSYSGKLPSIGDIIDQLELKDITLNNFQIYTRKPFLVDPKDVFFENIKEGEVFYAEVAKVYSDYIIIKVNNELSFPIIKEKLKPLRFFNTSEFYEEGRSYKFYYYNKYDIKGFDVVNYRERINDINKGLVVKAKIYKNLITKTIVRIDDLIECEIPDNELSYIRTDYRLIEGEVDFFKVLSIERNKDIFVVKLSKRLLGTPLFEFKSYFKAGDKIRGAFFHRDKDGFYFNLIYGGMTLRDISGFLPNEEIALYPNPDEFEKSLFNNEKVDFIITYVPELKRKDHSFNERQVLLSRLQLMPDNREDFITTNKDKSLAFEINDILLQGLKINNNPNKIYFKFKNFNNIVFSLNKDNFFPGLDCENNFQSWVFEIINKIENNPNENNEYLNYVFEKKYEIQTEISPRVGRMKNLFIKGINKEDNTIELDLFNGYFTENLKNEIFEFKVIEDDTSNKYIDVFGENFPKTKVKNSFLNTGNAYKFKLIPNDEIYAVLYSFDNSNIGENFLINIIKENTNYDNIYDVISIDGLYGILETESAFYKGEKVFALLKDIVNNKPVFTYSISYEDIIENVKRQEERFISNLSISVLEELFLNKELLIELHINVVKRLLIIYKNKSQVIGKRIYYPIDEILKIIESGFKRDEFVFESKPFGYGGFAKVFFGYSLIDHREYILKRFVLEDDCDELEISHFNFEAKVLSELSVEGVPKVVKYFDKKFNPEFVQVFASGKNFRTVIDKYIEKTVEWKISYYIPLMINLLKILNELNMHYGISHCDIKPENIIFDEINGKIKLIDFGSMQYKALKGGLGTAMYFSPKQAEIWSTPELLNSESHDFTIQEDIYSFGVMLYEIFTSKLPYKCEREEDYAYAHIYGQIKEYCEDNYSNCLINPKKIIPQIPQNVEDIILRCMSVDDEGKYNSFTEIIYDMEAL